MISVSVGSLSETSGGAMKYATIDKNGFPTGFFATELHGDRIPQDAISIPDEVWQAHIHGDTHKWDGKAWVKATPTIELSVHKQNAKLTICREVNTVWQQLAEQYTLPVIFDKIFGASFSSEDYIVKAASTLSSLKEESFTAIDNSDTVEAVDAVLQSCKQECEKILASAGKQ